MTVETGRWSAEEAVAVAAAADNLIEKARHLIWAVHYHGAGPAGDPHRAYFGGPPCDDAVCIALRAYDEVAERIISQRGLPEKQTGEQK